MSKNISANVCVCEKIDELEGVDAQNYCANHLKLVSVDGGNWRRLYECPVTGIKWVKDYPHGELQGGGSPRLRRGDNL